MPIETADPARRPSSSDQGKPAPAPGIPDHGFSDTVVVGPAGLVPAGSSDPSALTRVLPPDAATPHGAPTLPVPAVPRSAEAPIPEDSAGTPFGRYRLVESLGAGGMGLVWRAWDTDLRRWVALKQIREQEAGGADALARFQREARVAAKLRHPGIVAIHDVGEVDGKHYLTMDLLEGRTWEAILDETRAARKAGERQALDRLREEVALLADVTAAVSYAHGEGVIHRDIKPANVLIGRDGRPYVMDFGLAKEVAEAEEGPRPRSGATMTQVGQALGTPMYMSPEQAVGDGAKIGPGSDVYSLGILLYEVLAGETPFEHAGRGWEVMAAVVQEDPPPLRARRRAVPVDLEAVCLRALEKSPVARYRSAREFEEELRRWLRGDPVEARRPTLIRRAWRKTVRHRVWIGVGAVLLAALGVAWYFRWSAGRERAEAQRAERESARLQAEVLEQLREIARICVEETLAARREGNRKAGDRLRPRIEEAYRRARERLGGTGAEPEFHMGRMLRAVQEDDKALELQERALALDPAFAPGLYERAVLSARAYYRRRDESIRAFMAGRGAALAQGGGLERAEVRPEDLRPPSVEELEKLDAELRRRRTDTIDSLRRLQQEMETNPAWKVHPVAVLRLGEAQLSCVIGLVASFDPRSVEVARSFFAQAIGRDPSLEEAHEALIEVERRTGRLEEACQACDRGLEHDRGYVPFWIARAGSRADLGFVESVRGGDPVAHYTAAVADAGRALELDPRSVRALSIRGDTLSKWAHFRKSRGEDPTEQYQACLADHARALEIDPRDTLALRGRAWALVESGDYERSRGVEPDGTYQAAIADLSRAIEIDPSSALARLQRATAGMRRATHGLDRGKDLDPLCAAAMEDFARALELDPTIPDAWNARAAARGAWAAFKMARGEDALNLLRASVEDFGKALELRPDSPEFWVGRGQVRSRAGILASRSGQDAEPWFREALVDLSQALQINPHMADAWMFRAGSALNWAIHRTGLGENADEQLGETEHDFAKAIEINPALAPAWMGRGLARFSLAAARGARDQDPSAGYAAAISDQTEALRLNPALLQAWQVRGEAKVAWDEYRQRHGQEAGALFAEAVEDFTTALKLNPRSVPALQGRGGARHHLGTLARERGEPPDEPFRAALADLDAAISLNPSDGVARLSRGILHRDLAVLRRAKGEDPEPAFSAAEEDFSKSLEHNPNIARRWHQRGDLRRDRALHRVRVGGEGASGLYQEAAKDLARAIDLAPAAWAYVRARAETWHNWAALRGRAGEDTREMLAAAIADYGRSLALQPDEPETLAFRGSASVDLGVLREQRGEDPRACYGSAIEDAEAALRIAPDLRAALRVRAMSRYDLGLVLARIGEDARPTFARAEAELAAWLAAEPESGEAAGTLAEVRQRLEGK